MANNFAVPAPLLAYFRHCVRCHAATYQTVSAQSPGYYDILRCCEMRLCGTCLRDYHAVPATNLRCGICDTRLGRTRAGYQIAHHRSRRANELRGVAPRQSRALRRCPFGPRCPCRAKRVRHVAPAAAAGAAPQPPQGPAPLPQVRPVFWRPFESHPPSVPPQGQVRPVAAPGPQRFWAPAGIVHAMLRPQMLRPQMLRPQLLRPQLVRPQPLRPQPLRPYVFRPQARQPYAPWPLLRMPMAQPARQPRPTGVQGVVLPPRMNLPSRLRFPPSASQAAPTRREQEEDRPPSC